MPAQPLSSLRCPFPSALFLINKPPALLTSLLPLRYPPHSLSFLAHRCPLPRLSSFPPPTNPPRFLFVIRSFPPPPSSTLRSVPPDPIYPSHGVLLVTPPSYPQNLLTASSNFLISLLPTFCPPSPPPRRAPPPPPPPSSFSVPSPSVLQRGCVLSASSHVPPAFDCGRQGGISARDCARKGGPVRLHVTDCRPSPGAIGRSIVPVLSTPRWWCWGDLGRGIRPGRCCCTRARALGLKLAIRHHAPNTPSRVQAPCTIRLGGAALRRLHALLLQTADPCMLVRKLP